jgi:ATP-dependent 26S proteasome regulatory subunit
MDPETLQAFKRLLAAYPCVRIVTYEESESLQLALDAAADLRLAPWIWTSTHGLRRAVLADASAVNESLNPAAALVWLHDKLQEPAMVVMLDLADHLEDPRTLRAGLELVELFRSATPGTALGDSRVVLIDHKDKVDASIGEAAVRFEIFPPDDEEIAGLVKGTLKKLNRAQQVQASMKQSDFDLYVQTLRGLSRRQVRALITECVAKDRTFTAADYPKIVEAKKRLFQDSGVLEFIEAPASLDDIGGLTRLKGWLAEREAAFGEGASDLGLSPPRGVLLLGVQGAGKSLAARAIATAWKRPLMRLDPGNLYDRYIGESERRMRDAFRQAEAMSPVVLWIDEIEKGFAGASSTSTDGGLSRRMFGSLLTWMQDHTKPVFLVATANDIEALPPELIRKGRFDEVFFVDLPGPEVRKMIFGIHLRKRKQDPSKVDLVKLAAAAEGFSGSEIEQVVISALHRAVSQRANSSAPVVVTTDGLLAALKETRPLSVTMAEKVDELREWASGRCVPAD